MRPNLVLPFHDPDGRYFDQLIQIDLDLKQYFAQAYTSISPATAAHQAKRLHQVQNDPFFIVNENLPGTQAAEHYLAAYQNAITYSAPTQQLHLCDIDKVAFALQSEHRSCFIASLEAAARQKLPLLFQRSARAWATYPTVYRELEQMAIRWGELYFGRYFDFAWSYLIIEAAQLQRILSQIRSRDFGLLPEIVLLLRDELETDNVDWLAWEDPFIFGRDSSELRTERDLDPKEIRKRLLWNRAVLAQVLTAIE